MNTATILKSLLACTLLTTGCEFLDDIADTDGNDDDSDESGGDDEGEDADDDEGDDDEGDGGDAGDAGDSAEGEGEGADEESEGDGADESEGEGDGESESEGGGAACEPDTMACLDEYTIGVCVEGEVVALDCWDACVESGYVGAFGCFLDDVSGSDLCWCDDGSGAGEGGA
jgi:hypothetical protein